MQVGRVRVAEYRLIETPELSIYLLEESDGSPVQRWLPWEGPSPELAVAQFTDKRDAEGYGLGIDLIRSENAVIAETPEQIQALRHQLDYGGKGPVPKYLQALLAPPEPPPEPVPEDVQGVLPLEAVSA